MKRFFDRTRALVFIMLPAALALSACGGSGEPGPSPSSSPDAADAFVWGYPLVVTQRTLQTLGGLVGVNKLFNQSALSNTTTRLIVSPNQDTLYSVAVVDLRSEPLVLTVPDVLDRYWTYQFLDAWTTSFHYIGTRATGGKGGTFVITPPGYKGAIPAGAEQIASPTPQMFLLGRYLVRGQDDVANVAALHRRLELLSTVTKTPAPPPPEPLGRAPGTPQEVGSTGADFFDELGDALAVNAPVSEDDKTALERFEALGIGPGRHPAAAAQAASDASSLSALGSGVTEGMAEIVSAVHDSTKSSNGWVVLLDVGATSPDALVRAAVANLAWGINLPEEAIYARSSIDSKGDAYSGEKSYRIHFDPEQLPPVDKDHGFWSVTLYGPDHFFVDNPLKRFAIGDRSPGLLKNADGSLDLYLQTAMPAGHEANWLPAPAGPFELSMRLLLPGEAARSGAYTYPPVVAQ